MFEFFKGWRRKAGVVTLAMAFALAGLWARSNVVVDTVWFSFGDHDHCIFTFYGVLSWWKVPANPSRAVGWWTEEINPSRAEVAQAYPWFSSGYTRNIPFMSFVIPLALLSAVLLLYKPRPKSESTSNA
jgi:hypothetical protein